MLISVCCGRRGEGGGGPTTTIGSCGFARDEAEEDAVESPLISSVKAGGGGVENPLLFFSVKADGCGGVESPLLFFSILEVQRFSSKAGCGSRVDERGEGGPTTR